jgi:hypothetical protein
MVARSSRTSRAPVLASLVWLSGVSLGACRDAVDQRAEEPALAVAATISWDPKSQMKQIASTKGCDSWTPTWAPDGNLYTAYGDCRPKGAPKKIGMGFGRLSGSAGYGITFTPVPTGDPLDWDDAAAGAGVEAIGDGPASEKPAGMLHVDGRLWYWIRNITPGAGTGVRLKFSDNYSSADPQFTWVSWSLPEVGTPPSSSTARDTPADRPTTCTPSSRCGRAPPAASATVRTTSYRRSA